VHRATHAAVDALLIAASTRLGVVADKDRLAGRYAVHDGPHALLGRVSVGQAVVAVVVEAVGAFLGAFDKARILVIDRAGELNQQVLAFRGPHGCNEELLAWRPGETRGLARA
jgi:hypothetical protein